MTPSRRLRILITAGPTREYIDPVRFLSNDSSGRMGFAIAAVAAQRHDVTLVHGPVALKAPPGVRGVAITSADEMLRVCARLWPKNDVFIMAAAVADYAPARRSARKRKKSAAALTLRLRPTVDILKRLARRRRADQTVIGFALEDENARPNAERKLREKKIDAIVLNSPTAINAARSSVEIFVANEGWRSWDSADKRVTARRIVELAEQLHTAKLAQRPPRAR